MKIPEEVGHWLGSNGSGFVTAAHPVGGGCINHGARLVTSSGETFFVKINPRAPGDMFEREAEGLLHLSDKGGPRVPGPLCWGETFLLLEDLKPAPAKVGYWREFGRQLANLHTNVANNFGFEHDNYIGSTHQPNPKTEDGFVFFGQHRLLFQANLAYRSGLLRADEIHRVEKLVSRLPDLVPVQPASLIHGDLWSGNAITGPQGEPAMIDPAAHYGWAEAELAMTALFGGFHGDFYESYQETRLLDHGWRNRFDLYNLYHLLNHLNLFGSSYWSQVVSILMKYS